MTRPGAILWLLLTSFLAVAGCSDGPMAAPPVTDACLEGPALLALGDTVLGALEEDDCLNDEGRLIDRYALTLAEPTLFLASLTTVDYFPNYPIYLDSVQVSGWASDSSRELEREHLFPAGAYVVEATSLGQGADRATAPRGSYSLFTTPLAIPQEGCVRETTVTYGSVAQGRITSNDCEAVGEEEPGVDRRIDGYTFLLDGFGKVDVEVTADFSFRFLQFSNGQPTLQILDVPAGGTRILEVQGAGFQDFFILNEESGVGGSYAVAFRAPVS